MSAPEPIRLRHQADEYTLSLPIPDRWQVKSARLTLDFVHSNALIAKRSQLRVQINGLTVGQWRLDPNSPKRLETIAIPSEFLVPGYNELRFSAAQHYTEDRCEANTSPELWTEINPTTSFLKLEYAMVPPLLSLTQLNQVFDKKLPQAEIALLFPNLDLSEQELAIGSLIAQGIGLRLEYAPFRFNLAQAKSQPAERIHLALPQDQDAVLIGTRAHLAPFLDPQLISHIAGPYLGLFTNPQAPAQALIIVSGTTTEEVHQAALAFALMRFPVPDAQETVISKLNIDPEPGSSALQPNRTYTLAQLGFTTASRQGLVPPPIEFEVYLPADAFAPEEAEVVFELHLAYNAGLRQDSLLEMRINGIFERALQLPEVGGAHYRNYRISIPLRTFRPGRNRVSFHPLLVPQISGECIFFNTESLKVTIYEDSQVTVPPFSHYVELPDLSLLARAGFPYLASSDGSGIGVHLLDRKPETILSSWQLIAQLARLNQAPLSKITFSLAEPNAPLDWIVVGQDLQKFAALFPNTSVHLDRPKIFSYPTSLTPVAPQAWWRAVLFLPELAELKPRPVHIAQTGSLGRFAIGLSFKHPILPDKLITAFLAETELYPAIAQLTRPELWPQMQGDLLFWRKEDNSVLWQRTTERFYRGSAQPSLRLIFHFARHPWQWLGVALAVCLLLAWLLHRQLKRYKQRHHPDAEETAP
ncbi:MAG: cellulose biosynthesis cyclic di-GMP-binding regulatory protein BcsB [Methylohalobius sp.]|nr:cellulose biosynthesis cyclic di-GMP-binding regulatory protein BcsB [Methylohalobius sp.]